MTKIHIKTAHGYLSFQPAPTEDGAVKVQYRDSPGPWEEVEIENLTPATAPPPTTETPPPAESSDTIPASVAPPEKSAAYIGRVKSWLQGQGYSLTGPCGAFCIVEHAVWWMKDAYPAVGLLDKPDGNMCRGYATDIVIFKTAKGAIVDVLSDGGNANGPQWNESDPGEVTLDRWRPPVVPASKSAQAASTVVKKTTPMPTKR